MSEIKFEKIPTFRQAQKVLVLAAMVQHGGNKTHAAETLGICLRTLKAKLIEFRMTEWLGRVPGAPQRRKKRPEEDE